MGTKFDILSEMLLLEDSELSKFFTSSEPVRYIHDVLNLSGAAPVQVYSANRHEVWDHLRVGDAVLVVVHNASEIQRAKEELNNILTLAPDETEDQQSTLRDLNEIKTAIRTALRYTDRSVNPRKPKKSEQTAVSLDAVKKVKRLFLKKGASGRTTMDKIDRVYGDQAVGVVDTIHNFIKSFSAADRLLIKRVSHTPRDTLAASIDPVVPHATEEPDLRQFPIARDPDEKIMHQNYHIWYFSQDKFLKHEWKRMNVTHITRPKKGGIEEIAGYSHKSFYTIPNKSFQPVKTAKTRFQTGKKLKTWGLHDSSPEGLAFIGSYLETFPEELNVYYQRTQAGPVGAIVNPQYKPNQSRETDIKSYGEKGPVDERWLDDEDKYTLGQNIASRSVTVDSLNKLVNRQGVRYSLVFNSVEENKKYHRNYMYWLKHGEIPGSASGMVEIDDVLDDEL